MTEKEIISAVQDIFRDVFDDKGLVIGRQTNSSDIEDWDSLAQINLVVAIEKQFKIKFNLEELVSFKNVGDMIDLMVSKGV